MNRSGLCLALIAVSALCAPPAHAEEGLTERAAVQRAVERSPSLHVALLQAAQAGADVSAEEGLYSPVLRAAGGFDHNRDPSNRGINTTDVYDLSAGLRVPFSLGTVLDASLSGRRTTGSSTGIIPVGGGVGSLGGGAFGPYHLLIGALTLTQPLLRGAGTDIGLASLRQAKLRKKAFESAADASASALLNNVVRAYWELWYADRAVEINKDSRALALEQARQAEAQVKSGALAQIDALVYVTRSAELDEAVVLAEMERTQRSLALATLLADTDRQSTELVTSDSLPELVSGAPETALVLADAERFSPELRELEARVELAADQARIAGDALRPRLDIDAQVSAQGFGERVSPAFEQAGKLEAVSAGVGLTFETPLDGTRRRGQIASARLARHIAEKQLEAARLRIRADVRSALAARDSAEERVRLAVQTERVARTQAEGERRRFLAGASIALQAQIAENSLRQAELRLERARVDWVLAELTLAYLRGRLLERYRALARTKSPIAPDLAALPKSAF